MLSNPTFQYRPAQAPRDFAALVQSILALWLTSLRPTFWPALGYSLLSQVAMIPWMLKTDDIDITADPATWTVPESLLPDASTWLLAVVSNLAALVFLMVMERRQGLLTRGQMEVPDRSIAVSLRRYLPLLLASLGYMALNLLALAPVGIAWWLGSGNEDIVVRLFYLLIGLLLCAAPLAWVSVAAAFFYMPILLDGAGPWAALRESFRLVRGHWVLAASLLTLGFLTWMGIYSAISMLPLMLTGAIAFAMDGIKGLMGSGWMLWSTILSMPLMALTLPLLTASHVECFEELRRRHAATTPVSA